MNYRETFEDEGFVYELNVRSSDVGDDHLYTVSQGEGFRCQWIITGKHSRQVRELPVTDDNCEVIVFNTIDAAVRGAREFLSI